MCVRLARYAKRFQAARVYVSAVSDTKSMIPSEKEKCKIVKPVAEPDAPIFASRNGTRIRDAVFQDPA